MAVEVESGGGNPPVRVELRVRVHDTHASAVSPQVPGASSGGQSDVVAIGNFIKLHGARLGIVVVYE